MRKSKMKRHTTKGNKMKSRALAVVLPTEKEKKKKTNKSHNITVFSQFTNFYPNLHTFTALGWQAQLEWLVRRHGR